MYSICQYVLLSQLKNKYSKLKINKKSATSIASLLFHVCIWIP